MRRGSHEDPFRCRLMKILFLHGLESLPGGSKVEYLRGLGHDVLNPLLPKDDFEESVRIAQEEVDLEAPDLIVGSSRGGAVAMAIDPGRARLILIAPAWKHFEVPASAPANTDVLHCTTDDKVMFQDSQKLQGANLVPCGESHRMDDETALAALGRAVGGNLQAEVLLRGYVRGLLMEDPMGFVHDLAAASEEFGEEGEMFIGGDPGKGGGKAIKRAFNANADHQWLSTLDTVHWVEDAYSLEALAGKSKDELSTSMTLPGDKLKNPPGMLIGLWVKGRITLAANDHDRLFTGLRRDYVGSRADYTDEEQEQRQKSSGVNKLPRVSKDYSRYGQLKRGDEFAEKMARNTPYVLNQSTWHQADWSNTNEALVDNWKPMGIVAGKWLGPIKLSVEGLGDERFKDQSGVNAPGAIGKIFQLATELHVPIFDRERNELWSPE